jgi:hypothetical protein
MSNAKSEKPTAAGTASTASTQILAGVDNLLQKSDTFATKAEVDDLKLLMQEAIKKIENIATQISLKGTKKTSNATNPVPEKRAFPNNSLSWIKLRWSENKQSVIDEFFTDKHIQHMNDDLANKPLLKDLVGEARAIEEIKSLWRDFVADKKDETIKNAIIKAYEIAKKKQENIAKTPVTKEEE